MTIIQFDPHGKKNSAVEKLRAESLRLLDMAFSFVANNDVDEDDFAERYLLEYIGLFGHRTPALYSVNSAFIQAYPLLRQMVMDIMIMAESYKPEGDRFTLPQPSGIEPDDYIVKGQLKESVKALLVEYGFLAGSYDNAKMHRLAAEAIEFLTGQAKAHAGFAPDAAKEFGPFPVDPSAYVKK